MKVKGWRPKVFDIAKRASVIKEAKVLRGPYEGVLISPYPDLEGNNLQRPNSGFIQRTPHEAQYTS